MVNWKSAILTKQDTLASAIKVLNNSSFRIGMIADEDGKLLGTITDGDIRRSLIKHLGMDTNVTVIMCKNPVCTYLGEDKAAVLARMRQKDVLQIPVLDDAGKIIDLKTLHSIIDNTRKYDNVVFLMAGGFGKRLMPLTDKMPKPLLKVGEKPILETIISQFKASGFWRFVISTHYKANMIQDYFADGKKWDVQISYVYENEPLGTAGALSLLSENFTELPILMMNGDLLTKVNYEEILNFHNQCGGMATMGVREYDFQVPYGVVQAQDHLVQNIVEKPIQRFFVNAGIYVLSPELLKTIGRQVAIDMPVLLKKQIKSGFAVNMFPIHEYWLDIGRINEFKQAQIDLNGVLSDR